MLTCKVKLSEFGIKHKALLNTGYVKELIERNTLYVVPEDVHNKIMNTDSYGYIMLGRVSDKILNKNIGRITSIDIASDTVEIDATEDGYTYISELKDPSISFLAYNSLCRTSPIFYVKDEKKHN